MRFIPSNSAMLALPSTVIMSLFPLALCATEDAATDGRARATLGINGKRQEATSQDQLTFKLAYAFTPSLHGGFDLGCWNQDPAHRTASFLRDTHSRTVLSGIVAIDRREYVIPDNFFATGARRSENSLYGLSLGTRRESGWNVGMQASYFDRTKSQDRAASTALTPDGTGRLNAGDRSRWSSFDLRSNYQPPQIDSGSRRLSMGYHLDGYATINNTFALEHWRDGPASALLAATGGSTRTQAFHLQDAWQPGAGRQLTVGARLEQRRAFDVFIGSTRGATVNLAALLPRKLRHLSPKPDWRLNEHWNVGAGVDNLPNRRYFVYYPYPSRTVHLKAQVHL